VIHYVKALKTCATSRASIKVPSAFSREAFWHRRCDRSETLYITGNPKAATPKSLVLDMEHGTGPLHQPHQGWTTSE
jgi:hypothetical protein